MMCLRARPERSRRPAKKPRGVALSMRIISSEYLDPPCHRVRFREEPYEEEDEEEKKDEGDTEERDDDDDENGGYSV
jgi:hypothetical protein